MTDLTSPGPHAGPPGGSARVWALRGGLVALVWAAYYPVWQNGFVDYDDEGIITANEHVGAGLTADSCSWALFTGEAPYRIPLTLLTLQFDAELSARLAPDAPRPLPQVVHAQNLVWHSVNALLLFGLCRRLPGATAGGAGLVAALFAVHPMHVESVAWGVERKDVLMCAFGLVCVRAYLRYAETGRPAFYATALAALALSLAAKPMLLTMPFVLLLLDYWPLDRVARAGRRPGATRARVGFLVLEKAPFLALVGAVAAETMRLRPGVGFDTVTLGDRFMNALSGYGWYVSTTLWPAPLAVVYPHPRGDWSWGASLTGAAVLGALTAAAVGQARRRPWLFVGWLWFVGTLFPLIGFAQGGQQAWADRFSYWPHIGLFVALVRAASEFAAAVPGPARRAAAAGVLLALAAATANQVRVWHDSVTLWEHTLAVTERNAYAHERLALAYRRQGRVTEADAHLREAVRITAARRRAAGAR
jgi:hypothetical protein